MQNVKILVGDALERLRELPDESVHSVVTSPPYWGLRDYGTNGQLGLEATPEEHVERMVGVFREVRRVLRGDGTLWLNYGDCYASSGLSGHQRLDELGARLGTGGGKKHSSGKCGRAPTPPGLKPKDLVGMPWRVAFALQAPYEITAIKDRADRAWLAALIDGEGCITTTIAKPTTGVNESYAVVVAIRMSQRECLDRVVEITGMSKLQDEAHYPSNASGVWSWKIAGENSATVLAEIYPFLRIKRRQAVAAWNLQRLKDGITTKRGQPIPEDNMERRRALHHIIRGLNQRENVDVPEWCSEPTYTIEPGFYLRSDVIWHKPNPMPESVTDRPTKSHEHVFLLAKSAKYYYDADAVREESVIGKGAKRNVGLSRKGVNLDRNDGDRFGVVNDGYRNLRDVWKIATHSFKGAHFATFPPKLVEPCIKAGCPEGGTVLDCFGGAGTVGLVANRLGRSALLIELNKDYAEMARKRISDDCPMLVNVELES